ncbi:MAG: amidohydrolase family protein [Phycisphaeraceae bacterium]
MIVDVHTRSFTSSEQLGAAAQRMRRTRTEPWHRVTASCDDHDQAMHRVDAAFVLGFESRLLGACISHDQVAECVRRAPQRYHGFAGIDPTGDDPLGSLDRARELGLVGVTVSPGAQGFHPADTRAMALFEALAHHGMPLLVDPGSQWARETRMEFAQPFLLDELARALPSLRIVLAGLGHPFIDQGLALIAKHPTVFADLSELVLNPWQLYNALVLAHQQRVTDQLLFGSNFPLSTPEQAIVAIYSVNTHVQGTHLPTVPREHLRSIVERDALSCLKLSTPATTTASTPATGSAEATAAVRPAAPPQSAEPATEPSVHTTHTV